LSAWRSSAIFIGIDMAQLFQRFLLLLWLSLLTGCSIGPGNLQSRHSTDLETRKVRRIAVLPPSAMAPAVAQKIPFTNSPEPRTSEREAPETLARLVHSAMAALPNWQIVSENEVREVDQALPADGEASRLKRIGEMVYADAIITGRVQRFRERVGDEWGAKSPASVTFVLELIDVRRGDVIWSARFDETQKSLSENLFALGDFSARGLRWLSADELTQEGVKKAIGQLHQIIARGPAS
jgi:TolB-like protein